MIKDSLHKTRKNTRIEHRKSRYKSEGDHKFNKHWNTGFPFYSKTLTKIKWVNLYSHQGNSFTQSNEGVHIP